MSELDVTFELLRLPGKHNNWFLSDRIITYSDASHNKLRLTQFSISCIEAWDTLTKSHNIKSVPLRIRYNGVDYSDRRLLVQATEEELNQLSTMLLIQKVEIKRYSITEVIVPEMITKIVEFVEQQELLLD